MKVKDLIALVVALGASAAQATAAGDRCSLIFEGSPRAVSRAGTSESNLDRLEYFKTLARSLNLKVLNKPNTSIPWYDKTEIIRFGYSDWKFSGEITMPGVRRLLPHLQARGPGFVNLLADPGVAFHADALVGFLESCGGPCKTKDPWQLRELFSEHLGTRKLYRAVRVTKKIAREIESSGFVARGLAPHEGRRIDRKRFSQTPLKDQIWAHFAHGSNVSQFISLTALPEVAIAVARSFRSKNKIFLFELEMPELDVLSLSPETIELPITQTIGIENPSGTVVLKGQNQIEVFAFAKIDPSSIRKVTDVTGLKFDLQR